MDNENQNQDWKKVLIDILFKIITLGLYHIEKHREQ